MPGSKNTSEHGVMGAFPQKCPIFQHTRQILIRQVFLLRHFHFFLERSLTHAGDLALVSQLTEADTADTVVPEIGVGTAAQLAAVVLAGGELGRTGLLDLHRSLCHYCLPP